MRSPTRPSLEIDRCLPVPPLPNGNSPVSPAAPAAPAPAAHPARPLPISPAAPPASRHRLTDAAVAMRRATGPAIGTGDRPDCSIAGQRTTKCLARASAKVRRWPPRSTHRRPNWGSALARTLAETPWPVPSAPHFRCRTGEYRCHRNRYVTTSSLSTFAAGASTHSGTATTDDIPIPICARGGAERLAWNDL